MDQTIIYVSFTGWFILTVILLWRLHDDTKKADAATHAMLSRMAEIQAEVARILGTDRH
jgi:hypothetical protein